VALNTFIPRIQFDVRYIMTMIGFLGTTIPPTCFLASRGEIEEKIAAGTVKISPALRK